AESPVAPFRATGGTSAPARVGSTVLVVDDEVDLLEIVHAYLAELGYTTLTAKSGAEALEVLARQGPVHLLVTDIIMPGGLNGVDLAQMVLELSPQTRVIYSSGFTADALAERSMRLNGGQLLRKPFQRAEFCAAVRNVMGAANREPGA